VGGKVDSSIFLFLNGRLKELDFKLTKPSTGHDYANTNKHKRKLGRPARDRSTKCEELKSKKKRSKD
jgi:hypothetical protein